MKKTASFLILFLLILAYFVFSNGWYEPAQLIMRGTTDPDAAVVAQWDSGAGHNPYERRTFTFLPFPGDTEEPLRIIIEKGTGKHPDSTGDQIVVTELRVDDKGVSIPPSSAHGIRHKRGQGWYFDSAGSMIDLDLPVRQRISFMFKTSGWSGVVDISLNGHNISHDLYRHNWEILYSVVDIWLLDQSGNFTLSLDLPRYAIDSLQIDGSPDSHFTSVHLKSKNSESELPFKNEQNGVIAIVAPNKKMERFFHPVHLLFQILAALLVTSLILALVRTVRTGGGLKQLFSARGRWVFWLCWGGAFLVFAVWQLAFWPGIMSVDSLNIWRAALLPEVMINNHPFVNELWYFLLSLFWANIAIVPLVHNLILSTLIAATFYHAYRSGTTLWLLVPLYLLFLSSIPVGLYTTTLWKDVPFGLLVVLWGLVPAYLFMKNRAGEPVKISISTTILLLLSFFALLTFRHNGLIYLFVIPVLFFALRLVRINRITVLVCGLAGVCVLLLIVFPPKGLNSASYFNDLSRIYIDQIGKESIVKRAAEAARTYPRLLDIKKHQDSSDFWHYYLGDRYAYQFLRDVGWDDVYRYVPPDRYPFPELHQTALNIYRGSLEYPWLYLSWYPFVLLYLFPLSLLLCRWLPLSAIFSTVILAQIAGLLLFVGTTNWRYYYFALLGGYFLLPIILLDLRFRRLQKAVN